MMITNRKAVVYTMIALASVAVFSACGGGGGGGSVSPSVSSVTTTNATPTPSPTATPTPTSISGTLVDYTAGTPLSGFTVTVGALPNTTTCTAAQTSSANLCGVPASPVATATTSATGAFSVSVPAGTYFVSIGKDATYATLHLNVVAGALGTLKITALTADQQAWLTDLNMTRATIATPTSYANLVVDEFAQEQANTEANSVAAGTDAYGDTTEVKYLGLYRAMPNLVYSSAGSVQAVQPDPLPFPVTYGAPTYPITLPSGSRGYQGADAAWTYGEKANCPGGSWQGCTFASNNGHYINIANTLDVWAGLGESTVSNPSLGGKVYEIILPQS